MTLDNDVVKLNCQHEYHLDCIREWYKKTSQHQGGIFYNKNECPYCRKPGGYLPFKEGDIYDKDIHSPSNAPFKPIKKLILKPIMKHIKKPKYVPLSSASYGICNAITKQGTQCKMKPHNNNDGYCHIHCKKYLSDS